MKRLFDEKLQMIFTYTSPIDTSTTCFSYDDYTDTSTPRQYVFYEKPIEEKIDRLDIKNIKQFFWSFLRKINPPSKEIKPLFIFFAPKINEQAVNRRTLFSKAGKIPKRTRRRKKCRD